MMSSVRSACGGIGGRPEAAKSFRSLLACLCSRNAIQRRRAVEELAAAGAPPTVLFPLLHDRVPEVRLAVIDGLERIGGDEKREVTQHLLSAIDDRDPRVGAKAIHALIVHRAEEARKEVLAVLDDWHAAAAARPWSRHPFGICKAAVAYVAELGPAEAAKEHLMPLLGLPWPEIRGAAAWAIGRLRYRPAVPLLIGALERRVTQPWRTDAEAEEARTYIRALWLLGASEAEPALIHAAREAVGLRSRAVEALVELGPKEAAPVLVDLLADPGKQLHEQLLRLMVKAEYRPAVPIIRGMLSDRRLEWRRGALRSLAAFGDEDSAEAILAVCREDTNPFLRADAVRVFSRLVGEAAAAALEVLANDTNAKVCRVAAEELARLKTVPLAASCRSAADGSAPQSWSHHPEPPAITVRIEICQ